MTLALGPMPPHLRETVRGWIEAGRQSVPRVTNDALGGLFICGGPGGGSYLDADGTIRNWNVSDDSVEVLPDGPEKVAIIAVAARHLPELAEWLPRRPVDAVDCDPCRGSGLLTPPWPPVQCPQCCGLGWLPIQADGESRSA